MEITVNGERRDVGPSTTVELLVTQLVADTAGVAVAVNATVVPRSRWASTPLDNGAQVEVLTAAPGG
jgi:sulfur carrier protein